MWVYTFAELPKVETVEGKLLENEGTARANVQRPERAAKPTGWQGSRLGLAMTPAPFGERPLCT